MAKVTMIFAILLIALGLGSYFGTGSQHSTALIPTWFGLALGLMMIPVALRATEEFLRHSTPILQIGRHVTQEVEVNGEPVALTNTEYRLLYHLVRNAGRVVSHRALLQRRR